MYYAFNFWQLHTITLTASWRHVPGMAFQVCVVMEGLWFKIVMEDFYPHVSLLAVALSLASWRSPARQAPPPLLISSGS